jgi:PTH1 family peptidyl-tRNA hydrolase
MYLVVGLGNPGSKYARTRHNVGFDVVELLAEKLGTRITKLKCKALYAEAKVGSERVIIAQPQTFMNLSGQSVVELMNWFKVPIENVIVCYDDIDLELGALRVRAKGSAGTHNGMRSIVYLTGSDQFPRVRVGIGKPAPGWDLVDHVLAGYHTPAERELAFGGYQDAVDAVIELIKNGVDAATRLASERTALRYPKEAKPKKEKASNKLTFSEVGHHAWDRIRAGQLSGAACCVMMDGKNAYQGMFGTSNVATGDKLKKDSLFRLGALTRPVIAVAVMMMVERGQLDLNTPAEGMSPDMTVRSLLTSPAASAESFGVLVRMVEKLANVDFATFAKLMIFEPLKMMDTAWPLSEDQLRRAVTPYALRDGALYPLQPAEEPNLADGLYCSLSDYVRFARMLLGKGELDGARILEADSVQQIAELGLGVYTVYKQTEAQPLPAGAFGCSGAHGTHFWVDPDRKLTAVYLSSLENTDPAVLREFERDIYDVLDRR